MSENSIFSCRARCLSLRPSIRSLCDVSQYSWWRQSIFVMTSVNIRDEVSQYLWWRQSIFVMTSVNIRDDVSPYLWWRQSIFHGLIERRVDSIIVCAEWISACFCVWRIEMKAFGRKIVMPAFRSYNGNDILHEEIEGVWGGRRGGMYW